VVVASLVQVASPVQAVALQAPSAAAVSNLAAVAPVLENHRFCGRFEQLEAARKQARFFGCCSIANGPSRQGVKCKVVPCG
jgi:hypothetical protein